MRHLPAILAMAAALTAGAAQAADAPRTIVGLYANPAGLPSASFRLFNAAELPLNHLGLVLEPHDAVRDVPSLTGRSDVRGVLLWLQQSALPDPELVIALIAEAAARDIPVVILEEAPDAADTGPVSTGPDHANRALGLIGVRNLGGYRPYTFDMKIVSADAAIAGFERAFDGPLPPVDIITATGLADAALVLERGDGVQARPILITPKGAYVAPDYAAPASTARTPCPSPIRRRCPAGASITARSTATAGSMSAPPKPMPAAAPIPPKSF
jgi:hypothetical protein